MAKRHYIPVTADVPGISESLRAFIRKVIRTALAAQGVDFPCEVDVRVTGDARIREVNLEQRGVDRPTDVLSFPMFSMERVQAQAKEYGHSNRRELAYLVVHSVLHLLGYDHLDEGPEKARMRAREEAIMAELGLER